MRTYIIGDVIRRTDTRILFRFLADYDGAEPNFAVVTLEKSDVRLYDRLYDGEVVLTVPRNVAKDKGISHMSKTEADGIIAAYGIGGRR